MKETAKIREERVSRMIREAMLTLGLVALLCTSGYAGNITGNYQGMAYLAEQEIRTEFQARAAEEAEMVANAAATDEDSTQNDK